MYVLDLLPGGVARFHCHMGYHLQGESQLTCLNASLPVWSGKLPSCLGEKRRHFNELPLSEGEARLQLTQLVGSGGANHVEAVSLIPCRAF